MSLVWIATLSLGVIGAISAIILYFVAQKFKVEEDPRIGEVESVLPGANCGGCGYPGCGGFATACVKAETLDGMLCPVGGAQVMNKIAGILGMEASESAPKIAVIRCNGTCDNRPKINNYDSASNCAVASALYSGDTGCSYGCLGYGDCAAACQFGGIYINPETGLPEVDEELCTGCGSCVKACPKSIIELRNKGPKSCRVYVSCVNKDKGGIARKACTAACIGCGKCAKECPFEAITIVNNLAYIDYTKCKLCRKCETVCPTGAIHAVNFPPRKQAEVPVEVKPIVKQENTAAEA